MAVQSLPYKSLIKIDKHSTTPVFRQLANHLAILIKSGKLQPGHQLPASREMAAMLQLNRTTVVSAYEELQIQGWLEVIKRKGNFVASRLPVLNAKPFSPPAALRTDTGKESNFYQHISTLQPQRLPLKPQDLMINDGYPDARIAPLGAIYDRYKFLAKRPQQYSRLLTNGSAGSLSLRKELSAFLSGSRALNIEPGNVLITHGAQLAIFIAASMIIRPGSTVIVGNPNYVLANKLFEQLGAKLIKVDVDENGIDVDEIEQICKKTHPSLLYIIPHHHHPTTVTLSAERRIRLLEIIREYRIPVVEDDYDYDFHYAHSPILPLASSDHDGLIIYIGSISKTLAPTVRLGYLIAQEDFISQATKLKQLIEIRGDVMFEESVAHIFHTGEMQRHLRKSVQLYRQRRDDFCEQLSSSFGNTCSFEKPAGGMAVWATMPIDYSIPKLVESLSKKGIYMNDGSTFRYDTEVNGLRLGFASLNEGELQRLMDAFSQCR